MAKPNLALIPAAQGTKLYSVLPSNGTGDFDFTRGSTTNPDATRINAQGLIESVPNTSSRLNYSLLDGKVVGCPHHLLEPQRTNQVTYSEDFSNSAWTKSNLSVVSNNAISPDGTLNASKLVEGTNNGAHYLEKVLGSADGSTNTVSLFAKKAERNHITIYCGGNSADSSTFNLKNGTSVDNGTSTSKIELISNGWYRCSVTSINKNKYIYIMPNNGESDVYTGDGSSGIYVYGAQFEQASYPTSYIKSNIGSPTTRLAETASGAGSAATFNDSEGVLMAEISALANDGTYRVFGLSDGTTSNRVILYYNPNSNNIELFISSGGAAQTTLNLTLTDIKLLQKIAVKYKVNDIGLWINGFEVGRDTIATMPSGLNELAFDDGTGIEPFFGNVKQVQYFDLALADTQLEELTSWDSFSDMANGQLYTIE